ncbi:hypothetical protein TsFJ059_002307 [Trichoderma semiorbis]|uniref:GH18 domain-containing protein n=1 Tax=Trichoderma semiorbis TaxID=1491008 RepID=A0A9P8HEJ7_9HYPO|nr:hypothetical protein TsFJ059_002307 [Trichoderma semiorbis]
MSRLDGVDFDWEYPGAPDIPRIPPGSPDNSANYLAFLKLVHAALPSDYSVSLTAPASFWYLKGFPIADMMGLWNSFSDPGCPAGNCLRSQWVSWMKPSTYNSRSAWAQALGFGGIADWAVDLNDSYTSNGTGIGEGSGVVYIPPSIYNETSPTVACSPPCTFVFPPWTLSTMTTICQPPVTMTVEDIWPSVSTDDGGVTTTVYVSKTVVTTISIPPVITAA